ncbi:MAG: OmpH family outer membrane protein, partial [Elusimicrobia bacterium]|nr:OmpH family outer membrane protein [Elusimicrobiota bacterium]
LAVAVILALAVAVPAAAIELSLEENRAERGNIGYVDTQRLFKLFPETIQARENFALAVRQAEDQINLRKADILRLRKEIGELKVERAALAMSTPAASVPPARPAPAVTVSTQAAEAKPVTPAATAAYEAVLQPAASTTTAAALPGFGAAPQAAQPLVINLPGATTGPIEVAPPTAPPAPPPAPVAEAPAPPAPDALAAALTAFDERIAQKADELARKEAQARDEQDAAEKSLLELESRRSEILLGKIYRAVQEIARREGVSVVVDKTGILYGHNAVDLTEKVLKHLKGG